MWLCTVFLTILFIQSSVQLKIDLKRNVSEVDEVKDGDGGDTGIQIEGNFDELTNANETETGIEGRGFWDSDNYFIQKISQLFSKNKHYTRNIDIKRKADVQTPPSFLSSGLKPELLPPKLLFSEGKLKQSPPVAKTPINHRLSSQLPFTRRTKLKRRPISPGRYKRPNSRPQIKKSDNTFDQSPKESNGGYLVIQPNTAASSPFNSQANKINTDYLTSGSSNIVTRTHPVRTRPVQSATGFIQTKRLLNNFTNRPYIASNSLDKTRNIKTKESSLIDRLSNIASNVFSPLSKTKLPFQTRFQQKRPAPKPQRIILGPDERSDTVLKFNNFNPSPQQGSVLEDAFQPLFVASPSLDKTLPEDIMKPMHIPQQRIASVPVGPTEPKLVNFFS